MIRRRVTWLALAMLALSAGFLLWQLQEPTGFILTLRGTKLATLILVGAATGAATILFQTVAANQLLTPGLVGFDALYVFLQTLLVFLLGGVGYAAIPAAAGFLAEAGLMMLVAVIVFRLLFRNGGDDVIRILLTGVILGIMLRGLAELLQRLLDPAEFSVVQQASFASFSAVSPAQLAITGTALAIALFLCARMAPRLDVAALGRPVARGLGLDYDRLIMQALALVAALVAISTALVGPLTFLGLLAASLARELVPTHRHAWLIPAAALTGALILVAGQFVFERLLGQQSTLSVIVEFFGGLLFIALILRRRTL